MFQSRRKAEVAGAEWSSKFGLECKIRAFAVIEMFLSPRLAEIAGTEWSSEIALEYKIRAFAGIEG